jgi:hypothetical protein
MTPNQQHARTGELADMIAKRTGGIFGEGESFTDTIVTLADGRVVRVYSNDRIEVYRDNEAYMAWMHAGETGGLRFSIDRLISEPDALFVGRLMAILEA